MDSFCLVANVNVNKMHAFLKVQGFPISNMFYLELSSGVNIRAVPEVMLKKGVGGNCVRGWVSHENMSGWWGIRLSEGSPAILYCC